MKWLSLQTQVRTVRSLNYPLPTLGQSGWDYPPIALTSMFSSCHCVSAIAVKLASTAIDAVEPEVNTSASDTASNNNTDDAQAATLDLDLSELDDALGRH